VHVLTGAVPGRTAAPTRLAESRRLRTMLEVVLPVVFSASERLCRHERVRELYPEYLVLSHGIIRASVPLMAAAVDRARTLPGDPVAGMVAEYCERHIPEELGHDEWLLEDLAFLGVDPEQVRTRPPSPTVAALVGSQYYWIHHVHPVGLLGYVLLLEGWPPTPETVDELRRRTGYGQAAFRTLLAHADLDPHHGAELDDVLDALPLSPAQRELLGVSALTSAGHLAAALEDLVTAPPGRATALPARRAAR
jgi:hypothetical protein